MSAQSTPAAFTGGRAGVLERVARRAYPVGVILVLAALGTGVAVGLATGGSFRNLADIHFRWSYLAIAGLLLQWMPVPHEWSHAAGIEVGLLIASYVLLVAFVLANIRRPGMVVVAIGLLLNAIVIAANAGMPVTAAAVRSASGSSSFAAEVHKLEAQGGAKHRLAAPGDSVLWLSDRFGIGKPIEGVFSIGDFGALHELALINGTPQSKTLRLQTGKKYRIRLINISTNNQGMQVSLRNTNGPVEWLNIAKDGIDLTPSQARRSSRFRSARRTMFNSQPTHRKICSSTCFCRRRRFTRRKLSPSRLRLQLVSRTFRTSSLCVHNQRLLRRLLVGVRNTCWEPSDRTPTYGGTDCDCASAEERSSTAH